MQRPLVFLVTEYVILITGHEASMTFPAVQQGAGKQHPPARFGYLPTDIRGQNRRRPDLSFPNHRPPGAI